MKFSDVIKQLDADAKGKTRVMMGPLRALAKKLKTDHALGLELWETGRFDAQVLASMILSPREITGKQAAGMLEPLTDYLLVDELTYKAVAGASCADELAPKWRDAKAELTARAGWNLTVSKLTQKRMKSDEAGELLKIIEGRTRSTPTKAAESMMRCLAEIGARFPEHHARAMEIGTRWGVLDDRPVSKGCTPFYAPAWIEALLKRR